MHQVFATPYIPVLTAASCDHCDDDTAEIRAEPGAEWQQWTCRACYLGGMPAVDVFHEFELVQEARG